VTLTVLAIGDADDQVAPVVVNIDGRTLTSAVTSSAMPNATFKFTATSNITAFDFFADNSEAGSAFAGINGFSLTTVPDPKPSSFQVSYTRSVEAMDIFDYEVMWSNDLTAENWNTADIVEQIVSDNGVIQQVVAIDTSSNPDNRRFYRVQLTEK